MSESGVPPDEVRRYRRNMPFSPELTTLAYVTDPTRTKVLLVHRTARDSDEQLGKYKETKDSGLHLIIPFIQSMQLVDMREQVVDVPPQEVITSDNVIVSGGVNVSLDRVERAVRAVPGFEGAVVVAVYMVAALLRPERF